jgi:2-polyprenyl-3-methyl-5-hydroxy-6-metoxy-1,4-benzoquinol methylase
MDFSTRSYQPELLDQANIPFADIQQNMNELDTINRYLGGHRVTLAGIEKLAVPGSRLSICEIGCGGGDNLRAVNRWCHQRNIAVTLTGIDINPECIRVARSRAEEPSSRFIASDYRTVSLEKDKPDIVFSSLFCHHFRETEIISMLHWMRENSRLGFFINDLHRHPMAYHAIRILTSIFSKSYLVKNDAPLSVRRGFIRKEWAELIRKAGILHFSIEWKWAFRWLITVYPEPLINSQG